MSIFWFRNDLRLTDNLGFLEAARDSELIPLFIWHSEFKAGTPWLPGPASKWWLSRSLLELDRELRSYGSRLIIRNGSILPILSKIAEHSSSKRIIWNRRYEPFFRNLDHEIERILRLDGFRVDVYPGNLLFEPWEVLKHDRSPYKLFTPFRNACMQAAHKRPLPTPRLIPPCPPIKSEGLMLSPKCSFQNWTPGSRNASLKLKHFIKQRLSNYAMERDRPDLNSTSQLSPHLHFGEITPATIFYALRENHSRSASAFKDELLWREFSYHLLYYHPNTPTEPMRAEYANFPWRSNYLNNFIAWKKGQTGYPIIDAGIRQLLETGWMHNRVRMIVASFLIKDLLVPWQEGARFFWKQLLDADLAVNTLNWQWNAGSGVDAAPFFRIFNPTLQAIRFDPNGDYVRRWIPELASLDTRWIHRPLLAPGLHPYPRPIIDHRIARTRALRAFRSLR